MKDFNKYFIVGTNSDALHDTMNGMVVGKLIRCKDCKYGERWAPDKCYCNGFLNAWVDEDDFCAWAEPKEADG